MRGDYEIVKKAVSSNGHALQYATEDMQANHDIVVHAVCQTGFAVNWATEDRAGVYMPASCSIPRTFVVSVALAVLPILARGVESW